MTTLLDLMGDHAHTPAKAPTAHGGIASMPPAGVRFTRVANPMEEAVYTCRSRLKFAAAAYAMVLAAFAFRMADMSLANLEESGRTFEVKPRQVVTRFHRADVVDRNGILLATNLSTSSVFADPSLIPDATQAATQLRTVFPELSHAALVKSLTGKGRFAWIKRNITPQEQYEVNMLGIPGVSFEREEQRIYPHGRLFSHALGFVNIDNKGAGGLERAMEAAITDPKNQQPFVTSLDMRAQYVMHDELTQAMETFRAKAAVGLLMDAKSGELLSMVSLPDFDPHHPAEASDDARFNRASLGTFEMGSTFKMFTFAMALQHQKIRLDEMFDVSKPIHYARHVIHDSHPEKRPLSGLEVFTHSSNIGTVKIVSRVGMDLQKDFLRQMGMFEPVQEVELSERGYPLYPKQWKEIQSLTISFGHGMSVTPLHLIRAMDALVSDGRVQPLTLLHREQAHPSENLRDAVVSPQTIQNMRLLLRTTVAEGTAKTANIKGYAVGGKTGTAEKVVKGRYDRKSLRTSFAAAFPIQDPQYVMLVMLDEPKPTKKTYGFATAGWNAVPTAGRIIARVGPMLGLQPIYDEATEEENPSAHIGTQRE